MTDGQKLQHIHDDPKVNRKWSTLTKEQRRFVLAGLELGVNQEWMLALIEDAKELSRRRENTH
ncbi:hypothetical protein [Geitlerinema calcuttense]|uniref:Uncharacterized protein n=1 Tax=Geitlerinema calcuttense NRMC-F 0142 TaxID=2922238 RepID=A0ABT7LV62_9CYAN|nr:hypothetical protein [Geitlerinema calcuttense]MDL5055918.1 hypothetical protein [Geitlerinema calcuttense NRMC-F 0142]